MKLNPYKKQTLTVTLVLAVGATLAWLILSNGTPQSEVDHNDHPAVTAVSAGHSEQGEASEAGPHKGPHGGKLFTQNGYGLEVTIFEQDVEPEFRVYTYLNGKLLDPAASRVSLTLDRLGRQPQVFSFMKVNDYLKGDAVVEEPHSFKTVITAQHNGKVYRFSYEQIEARVSMTDQQLRQNKVEVLTAGPAQINSTLQLIGEIGFNQDRLVHVVPRLAGVVSSVTANSGDRVRKGQVLAVINSQVLADQRSELLAAQKRLTLARTTFEREKRLWEDKISAEQDYLQARNTMQEAEITVQNAQQKLVSLGGAPAAGGNLTRYEIRAPIDGIVMEKHISLGEAVKDDTNIFVIADLSTVWAEMTIYPKDLNTVRVGQDATIRATAFEAQSRGKVSYVGSLVGEQTRTAKARIVLPNPQGIWRPGLPVSITLVAGKVDVPVAVSAEAIQTVRDWTVVFGRYGTNFEARPLELGRSDGHFVEVIRGLNAGEQYAAKNSFLIKADQGKSGASHDH